ncbi:MAG: family 20 glycosylhydrolase [Lentisphaeria bacterium]|nr:family 20 glycosylhydrolase [Lentisphaeria bacterium]
MKSAYIFLFAAFCCCTVAMELTPVPKYYKKSGKINSFDYCWRIKGQKQYPEAAAWLQEEFNKRNWKITADADKSIDLIKVKGNGNEEYYTLDITEKGIVIGAATKKGMFRGIGRFLAILKNPSVVCDADKFTIPSLQIKDYPDFPIRSMTLTMCFWEPFSAAERLESTQRIIEIMALHGFNYVFMTLGNHYESKYFKNKYPVPWTKADLRKIVRFANARGVVALPSTQFVSHWQTGPQVCLLKNSAGKVIGHDIKGTEFYKVMPLVIDELLDIFENPPYFRVGGDEANGFFRSLKLKTEENAELFAKAFNFLAEHLAKRKSRAVMWHDMLFAKELGGRREQLGGIAEKSVLPAKYAMSLLNKDIVMNYWHYGVDKKYSAIKHLQDAGFEVWASTWYFRDGIFALGNSAGKQNVKAFDGTTWCNNHTKGEELVLVGELGWNRECTEVSYDPTEVFMREWSSPPFFVNAKSAVPLVFDNARFVSGWKSQDIFIGNLKISASKPVAGAETVFTGLSVPDDIVKLKKERSDTELFLSGSGESFVLNPSGINRSRKYNSMIVYTPSYGEITGQNKWGDDWSVVNNRVVKFSSGKDNVVIPRNGCVISAHKTGAELHNNTRKIMKSGSVEFIVSQRKEPGDLPVLTAKCKNKASGIVLVFASKLKMYCDSPRTAAVIQIKSSDGKISSFKLNADFALYPNPKRFSKFKVIYLPGGKAAVVWNGQNTTAKEVNISFTHMGTAVGTTLLGAVEM